MTTYIGNPPKSVYGVKDATNLLYRETTTAAKAEQTLSGIFQDYNMEDTLILDITGEYIGTGNSSYVSINGDTTNANYRSMENYRESGAPANSVSNSASSYIGWLTGTGYYSHRITITPIKVVGGTRFKLDCEFRLNETTSPYEGTLVNTTITHVVTQTDLTSIAYKIDGTTNIQANTTFSLYNTVATNLILPLEYSAPRQNMLINSDFNVNQRGYVNGTNIGYDIFTRDRWFNANGAASENFTFDGAGKCTLSNNAALLGQRIEITEAMKAGDLLTMSWKGTATGWLGEAVSNGGSHIITSAEVTAGYILVYFGGASATLWEPKVEGGEGVTPWEVPDATTELLRCKRYYQTLYIPTFFAMGFGRGTGATTARTEIKELQVPMRDTPTGNTSTSGDIAVNRVSTDTDVTAAANVSVIGNDSQSYYFNVTTAIPSANANYRINTTSTTFTATFSAEL